VIGLAEANGRAIRAGALAARGSDYPNIDLTDDFPNVRATTATQRWGSGQNPGSKPRARSRRSNFPAVATGGGTMPSFTS